MISLPDAVSIINKLLPEPHASLLAGMLFGVRADMPPSLYNALIGTGTLHVIALSGMNISIIIRVIFDSLLFMFGRIVGVLGTALGIWVFVLFVGASPSIVRAAIMGSITMLGVLFGRKDYPLLSLTLAVLTMYFYDRSILGLVSFQLSMAATLGIIIFGGAPNDYSFSSILGNESWIRKLGKSITQELRVTLSAQFFTVPLIMYYFHQVSVISPIANVSIGFLIAPITIGGFIMVLCAFVWFPLGRALAFFIYPLLAAFMHSITFLASLPMASFVWE